MDIFQFQEVTLLSSTDQEFKMILPGIISTVLTAIPSELTLRDNSSVLFIGIGLFVSFLLMAFAKLLKPTIYIALVFSSLKIQGLSGYVKESHPLNGGGSILLIINYLLASSIVLFILVDLPGVEVRNEMLLVGLTPFLVLFWSVSTLQITGLISGERQLFVEPVLMKLIGTQFLGIIYFVLALVWVLNPFDVNIFVQIAAWTFIGESFIRILKSIIIVSTKGVSWYYIILYFCTLEILPPFVIYYFLLRN